MKNPVVPLRAALRKYQYVGLRGELHSTSQSSSKLREKSKQALLAHFKLIKLKIVTSGGARGLVYRDKWSVWCFLQQFSCRVELKP